LKTKLRVREIQKEKGIELPDNAVPIKLEHIIEPNGLVNPGPSEKYLLYYLEKER